ncbi:hypothetical protein LWI29_011430 [Acer saccharum]|uniref:RNase H type-1 domain-containing protein n=1 Tax=Acer saccharum TaxID=4024 RepID=A0AA39SMG7_ACESA|nr:hypothetical protein LWI29_011430 [Acer saccharum]
MAKILKLPIQLMEVDACNVASAINGSVSSAGSAGCIIEDIKALCKDVGVLKCQAIPRSGNGMAHTLAARAFSYREENLWQQLLPSCFSSFCCS